ncbi:triphosphoribosyl-dephospho-CoA synthase CitG [Nguyenibacter vanlangensis]|uniref:Probable 2-(5''-triphosphoribosyl)-3'-dephosphocoenzyme-A synthase n=1 Tax=Nguyenibacter vanlangensis TaxID=1216886 RepID=A0ABZ3D0K4_9PROT
MSHSNEKLAVRIRCNAERALLTELFLTPKPGLVDRRNSGAHNDMTLQTFIRSINAISPWFLRFFEWGASNATIAPGECLALIRPIGFECETAMFAATGGINTHKGAIFALGLLSVAAGRAEALRIDITRENLCFMVADFCHGIVGRELGNAGRTRTAGERVYRRYGLSGARGEAESGFATVRRLALPIYDDLLQQGDCENHALMRVLLELLAFNADTNLVSRGGVDGLTFVRDYASNLLLQNPKPASDLLDKLCLFDDALIARNLSPGGSADLLAVTWFLAQLPASKIWTLECVDRHFCKKMNRIVNT